MAGGKYGQTLFHKILPATSEDLTSAMAVDWHLKVKNIEYYCITVSMFKSSQFMYLFSRFYAIMN